MNNEAAESRRAFLNKIGRGIGLVAVGGVAWRLVARADADKVWQLDPDLCTACNQGLYGSVSGLNNGPAGLARCATECVLKKSAVKAVNDFEKCGYCMICPAYHDVTSPTDEQGVPIGRVCPYDAIIRKPVGPVDPSDPNNNYYEYTIDESKCTGCGKCIITCKPPMGNGSLRLEIRHNLCVDCNQCLIATACPPKAFIREPVKAKHPGR